MSKITKNNKSISVNNEKNRYYQEIMISLFGRIAFTAENLTKIVEKGKRNPENYVKVYNACDGEHTVSELAKIARVTQGTMTPILQKWEEEGIIFQVERTRGKFYKKLFPI